MRWNGVVVRGAARVALAHGRDDEVGPGGEVDGGGGRRRGSARIGRRRRRHRGRRQYRRGGPRLRLGPGRAIRALAASYAVGADGRGERTGLVDIYTSTMLHEGGPPFITVRTAMA